MFTSFDPIKLASVIPAKTRVRFASWLWDTIPEDSDALALTPAQMADLERRMDNHAKGETTLSWAEIQEILRPKS